jgi:hypothetical protein
MAPANPWTITRTSWRRSACPNGLTPASRTVCSARLIAFRPLLYPETH